MEFSLWPLGFMEILQKNNHQAVNEVSNSSLAGSK